MGALTVLVRRIAALAGLAVLGGVIGGMAGAQEVDGADTPAVVAKLKAVRPDIPIESAHETELEGVYALELTNGTVFYGTADGRFLFVGDMYQVTDDGLINLTESERIAKRRVLIDGLEVADLVVFPADGERKAVVNVFTDVDCSFCRKLHLEMADFNALGIEVRYLAYPRTGIGTVSYDRIVSAWCADDRNHAITELKLGNDIPERTCPNPVADHYELGQLVGVTGTPAIVTEDGRLLPGYMPATDLAQAVGL